MTKSDLLHLVGAGEGVHVEFVRHLDRIVLGHVGQVVSAFLNCGGGVIFIGISVNSHGDVQMAGEFDLGIGFEWFERELRKRISPVAPVFFEKVDADGAIFPVIIVPAGLTPPYAFDEGIYVRRGSKNVRASMSEVRELVLLSETGQERWENRFATPQIHECIDSEEIRQARNDCRNSGRIDVPGVDVEAFLEALSLSRFGRLLNAGVLIFAKHPGVWCPQARLRMVCFKSDKADDFEDARVLDGPLCSVIGRAVRFIQTNTRSAGKFSRKDGSRRDIGAYPPMAIREALVNACAHRDYASAFGGVSVMIYPDRLEILNSGMLPKGVTIDGLNSLKGQPSVLQNPTVSNVLYLRGFMEQTGRGSVLIPEECQKFGLPAPKWEMVEDFGVKIIFRLSISASGTNNGTNRDKTDVLMLIFDEIRENSGISRKRIIERLNLPARTVQRCVDELLRLNKIKSHGKTRAQGYWCV